MQITAGDPIWFTITVDDPHGTTNTSDTVSVKVRLPNSAYFTTGTFLYRDQGYLLPNPQGSMVVWNLPYSEAKSLNLTLISDLCIKSKTLKVKFSMRRKPAGGGEWDCKQNVSYKVLLSIAIMSRTLLPLELAPLFLLGDAIDSSGG